MMKKKSKKKLQKKWCRDIWRNSEFWANFNFAAIFGHFHMIKSDKSNNVSEYCLYKSNDEEKK